MAIDLGDASVVYDSDLSDQEWAIICDLIPPSPPIGRDREVSMRAVVNAIFYLNRTGCQWRMLPKEYPPWSTVYNYYAAWRNNGTWQQIHDTLRDQVREQAERDPQPSAAILDSQSVKTAEKGGCVGLMPARK